jgi:hypothetical protein
MSADFAKSTERVAWIILQTLHENVPEDKRPMSWSDLSEEQSSRIHIAAQRAINETLLIKQEIDNILLKGDTE